MNHHHLKEQANIDNGSGDYAPELYMLTLFVQEMPHRNRLYKDVQMSLCRNDMPPHELNYSALIEGSPVPTGSTWGDYEYSYGFINELFSPEETQEVEAYFERHPHEGTTLHRERLTDWPCANLLPTLAIPVGGSSDFWMFDQSEHFDCPVKFWGYFDVCDKVLVACKQLSCEPSGEIDLGDFRLTPEQAAELFESWQVAQNEGKTIEVTVKMERPEPPFWPLPDFPLDPEDLPF